jgi:tRNA1(Val) A37 N6-methylase TrmN6
MGRFFKGWAKPGELRQADPPDPPEGETLDAISGDFRIFQLKKGHRFSTDDVLTAWYGTSGVPQARSVLDLGSGIGSVGMISAWRLPFAKFVTVEAQSESVRLARKSAVYNDLKHYDIREGDFRDEGILGADERFDLILGSPPYFPEDSGPLGDHPQKRACRFELRGDIRDYCRTAAKHLDFGGVFACVFPMEPPHQKLRVEEAIQAAQLCLLRYRPVVLKEGDKPLLGLFLMSRKDHLPESMHGKPWQEPPLIIRTKEGDVHPEYKVVKLSIGFPP